MIITPRTTIYMSATHESSILINPKMVHATERTASGRLVATVVVGVESEKTSDQGISTAPCAKFMKKKNAKRKSIHRYMHFSIYHVGSKNQSIMLIRSEVFISFDIPDIIWFLDDATCIEELR